MKRLAILLTLLPLVALVVWRSWAGLLAGTAFGLNCLALFMGSLF